MSHVTTLKVQIKNLQALEEACQKIGLKFNRHQKHYKWWGRFVGDYAEAGTNQAEMGHCDHAISVPGNDQAYEIGVTAKGDGYVLQFDFYGQGGAGVEAVAGLKCSKLIDAYTKIVTIKEATKLAETEGYVVSVEEDAKTGETVITLRSYAE